MVLGAGSNSGLMPDCRELHCRSQAVNFNGKGTKICCTPDMWLEKT